jgi:hypothetical protein
MENIEISNHINLDLNKFGFVNREKNINGFLPKNQMLKIIKDFVKENSKDNKPLSNKLYFLNLHRKNKTIKTYKFVG